MSSDNFNIDLDRKGRLGFPEVIFGQSKTVEQLKSILAYHQQQAIPALATKVQAEKAQPLLAEFPEAFFDEESGVFGLNLNDSNKTDPAIVIVSGGTSDAYVVNEVFYTLRYLGVTASRIQDVGVSGLHRLMNRLEEIKTYKIIIAVAGFEAALPTVLGGLVAQPIIAVPTSVGYGVAAEGQVALHSLLASCANGITVVNIDNGYGAAIAAFRMLHTFKPNQP
ncbi:nickel pincer cofactor biosynthesis protein LarB [Tunicatimonas pelagia]|uniref:nickel pincer cofactor biosynthesis protein LarB n=1 Tax=Tunicatimonas pelagia TaxID=931531 RepID=UPI0026665DAD|nr:nickel pincer cofactor biosynthesis protein LarB [Tunicatimonas pelagia]WKN43683.1 nickel pincer cofactor biosynthesis protein LarB [Tunicatimonas pelagia]